MTDETTVFLTRAEIQQIVDGMTARDIFAAMPGQSSDEIRGADIAGAAFDAAAKRQELGEGALDRVRPSDATWLAELLSEALNAGSPKADGTEVLQASPATGD